MLIERNRGLSYKFILGRLPRAREEIFVDAALSGGIGGYFGWEYFSSPIAQLRLHLRQCDEWESFPAVNIALPELFAATVAIYITAPRYAGRIITLYSDNTNTVQWMTNRRPPNSYICALIAAIERVTYKYQIKVSARYILGDQNTLADRLSRGDIPSQFERNGLRLRPPMETICKNLRITNIYNQFVAGHH